MSVQQELELFRQNIKAIANLIPLAEDAVSIGPNSPEPIDLTFLGVTHGNESVGVYIFNQFLTLLKAARLTPPRSLSLVLGNPRALLAGRRFIDRDLNRSFGDLGASDAYEAKRAQELKPLLSQTKFLVDFHQTNLPSESPFFIFPYRAEGLKFARHLAPTLPIVTHWGAGGFSQDGICSDEYVISQGGCGITLELGKAGFDPLQVGLGLQVLLRGIGYSGEEPARSESSEPEGGIYVVSHSEPYPSEGDAGLEPGWINFSPVAKGTKIGHVQGKSILAEEEGWILFPKYLKSPDEIRPKEMFRLLRKISPDELPQH